MESANGSFLSEYSQEEAIMGQIKLTAHPSKRDWNLLLSRFSHGNLQQTYEYGEVIKMANPRTRVIRLLVFDGTTPVGLVQARYNRRFGFGNRMEIGGVYGYGPVLIDTKNRQKIFSELINTLEKYAIRNRISDIFIYQLEKNGILERMGYAVETSFNAYKVNLKGDSNELWKKIAHNKRRNIKKALTSGVKVIQGTNNDFLESFYDIYLSSARRVGFIPYAFKYFNFLLKIFGTERSRVFLAVFHNEPIATVFTVIDGDTLYALAAGSREQFWHVRPNDLLHWKAMEWACKKGLSFYHMGYVSDPPPKKNQPGWGLWRWKREWNGLLEKVFIYHKVLMPKFKKFILSPYEKVYNAVRRLFL